MKILIYSDLHLEFGDNFRIPSDIDADILILAGDIITFNNFQPLYKFLKDWRKPVIFVAGNHEYYTKESMSKGEKDFYNFIKESQPNITWLRSPNESIRFDDVEFFGDTMWTDFNKSDPIAMLKAYSMNDYRMIYDIGRLRPEHTVRKHEYFRYCLEEWLKKNEGKKRVVISHHAPVENPKSKYKGSKLTPAFVATDMLEIIEKYQPDCWVYGHCLDQESEILTERGWQSRETIKKGEVIYSFNSLKNILEKDEVVNLIKRPNYFGDVYEYFGSAINFRVTEDHNIAFQKTTKSNLIFLDAKKFFSRKRSFIRKSAVTGNKGLGLPPRMLELYAAIAADGSKCNSSLIRFVFTKQRKIDYILELLNFLKIEHRILTRKDGVKTSINFTLPEELKNFNIKGLDHKLIKCSQSDCEEILKAYSNTDGRIIGKLFTIYTSKDEEKDLLQHIFTINGFIATCHSRIHGFGARLGKMSHSITIRKQELLRFQPNYVSPKLTIKKSYGEDFWCVETNNRNFFMRRKGKIMLIGNTHECDNQQIGKTKIVSNQRGYEDELCEGFNERFILEI